MGFDIVMMVMIMTTMMTFGLSVYACTTSTDVTYCGGLIYIFIFSFISFMYCMFQMSMGAETCGLGFICVGFAGFYIIYDVQLIMGGKRMALSVDDYVIAVIILYVDIIRLFLEILQMFGKKD